MKLSPLFAIGHFIITVLFAVFARLQVNDIDPAVYHKPSSLDAMLWFSFYLLIAALFVVSVFRKVPPSILIVSLVACVTELIMTGPGFIENLFGDDDFTMTQVSMSAEDPRVELTREFAGALIAFSAVLYLLLMQRKIEKAGGQRPPASREG